MGLKVYYQNANGLKTKISDVRDKILGRLLDVIILCETWLNSNFFSEEIFDDSYTVYRLDRDLNSVNKKDGGGCLIAVKSKYASIRLTEWETLTEDVWVAITQSDGSKLFVNVRYIPVRSTFDQYNVHYKKINDIVNMHGSERFDNLVHDR